MNKEQQKELDRVNAFKKTFGTKEGGLVLKELLRSCNFFTGTFNSDHAVMAFEEGRRSTIMEVLRIIQLDVEELLDIQKQIEKEEMLNDHF